ncbi:hypothetical protein [Microbacterium sp. GXS0129]|uniref:hypothetical protein n=1 Tax=Microbacterium sp. GXS0129 TaxID=3377836 RepID=UPI00383A07F7
MGNSAEELHALYTEWRGRMPARQGSTVNDALKPNTAEGIAEIIRAYGLLSTIDQQLKYLASRKHRVSVYQRQLGRWARVPLSLNAGWGNSTMPEMLVSDEILEQIEGLSYYLDGKVLAYDEHDVEQLRPLIDRADSLLTDDDDMDPRLKMYLRRLIGEIRLALDDEHAGRVFDFTTATERLWVAFTAAADQAKPEAKGFWRELAGQIVPTVVGGAAVEAARIALEITTGLGA